MSMSQEQRRQLQEFGRETKRKFREYARLDPRLEGLRKYVAMVGGCFARDEPMSGLPHWEHAWDWLRYRVTELVGYRRVPMGSLAPEDERIQKHWRECEPAEYQVLYTGEAHEVVGKVICEALFAAIRKRRRLEKAAKSKPEVRV